MKMCLTPFRCHLKFRTKLNNIITVLLFWARGKNRHDIMIACTLKRTQ